MSEAHPQDTNDDELKQALAAFGDDAMDLLDDDDEEFPDELLAAMAAEPKMAGDSADADQRPYANESQEICIFGFDEENDSPLVRYTKELANAIYCGSAMPDNNGQEKETKSAAGRFVVFAIGPHQFGFPLQAVREIIRCPKVTPLPRTPSWLRGVTNVRGQIVSVTDLRRLLKLEDAPNPANEKTIVIHSNRNNSSTAIVADRVLGIRNSSGSQSEVSDLVQRLASIASGVASIDQIKTILIDPDKLFESRDLVAFFAN